MTAVVLWVAAATACIAYLHHRRGVDVYPHAAALHVTHEYWIRRGAAIGLGAYALLKLLLAVLQSGGYR